MAVRELYIANPKPPMSPEHPAGQPRPCTTTALTTGSTLGHHKPLTTAFSSSSKQENGEISLFNASSLRERAGDGSSQLLASRGREGSFELRYQQPFEDFRVSPEQLADHFESRERR